MVKQFQIFYILILLTKVKQLQLYIYTYLREFQYMVFVPDNNTLSSDQDIN